MSREPRGYEVPDDYGFVGKVTMAAPHDWRECRPVVLDLDASSGRVIGKHASARLAMAWSLVPDRDRRLFHAYCCLNLHNAETHATIGRIGKFIRLALNGEGDQ